MNEIRIFSPLSQGPQWRQKASFMKIVKKILYADITVISSKGDITYYKENRRKGKTNKQQQQKNSPGNFPESCPLKTNSFDSVTLGRNLKNGVNYLHL